MSQLDIIEKGLGIPGLFTAGLYEKYGPQWAGRKVLKHIWVDEKKRPAVLRRTSFDLRDLPFGEAAQNVAWRRELQEYMIGWYCHYVDKNSQYLAADRGMYTGIGDPEHIDRAGIQEWIEEGIMGKLPGIYRLSDIARYGSLEGAEYPSLIEEGQEWITLDVLRYGLKTGFNFDVSEAWIFPDYERVLDVWALRLWNTRAVLKGLDKEAYDKIKLIATTSNGAWNWNQQARPWNDKRTELIHPNWWSDTVGKARVALLANLITYGPPVCIEIDGLFFVTRNSDARTAILSKDKGVSILARENELGGYKHKGSCQVTRSLFERAKGKNAGQLAELFKGACDGAE